MVNMDGKYDIELSKILHYNAGHSLYRHILDHYKRNIKDVTRLTKSYFSKIDDNVQIVNNLKNDGTLTISEDDIFYLKVTIYDNDITLRFIQMTTGYTTRFSLKFDINKNTWLIHISRIGKEIDTSLLYLLPSIWKNSYGIVLMDNIRINRRNGDDEKLWETYRVSLINGVYIKE